MALMLLFILLFQFLFVFAIIICQTFPSKAAYEALKYHLKHPRYPKELEVFKRLDSVYPVYLYLPFGLIILPAVQAADPFHMHPEAFIMVIIIHRFLQIGTISGCFAPVQNLH